MALRFPRFSQGLAHDPTTRRIWFGIAITHDFESHDDITEECLYQNIFASHFGQLAIIFLWIKSGDQIDYRNMSLISRFISEEGKISRQVNRLTLKQQRLNIIAIKQARILSLLPFLNNEKQFERSESTARAVGLRTRKKNRLTVQLN